jgi:ATP-dependent Clp protease ATP-binding subunit ClpA
LKDVRVVALDHVALLAGTAFRGQYEERIRKLVRELSADPDLVLFVDELHNLIGQGTALGAAMDAANMLKPALVRGDIRIIGATTGGEYDKWIRGDPALERRFQPVLVDELDAIQAWEVLVARRPRLERHHAVAITDDALKAAIVLTDRFVPERARPDKAIDVLDEACAHAQATARVSPELDQLIRERRKVDALIRRDLTHQQPRQEPPEDLMAEIFPMLERIGSEIEKMLGGGGQGRSGEVRGGRSVKEQPAPTSTTLPKPPPTLSERREDLDRLLRQQLESQGIVVGGQDVARVVGAAVGKGIEWQA